MNPDRAAERLALRAAQAKSAVDLLACSGAAHRAFEPFGSVLAGDSGVPEPWSVQLSLTGPAVMRALMLPVAAELRAAIAWATDRSAGRGFLLGLPEQVAPAFEPDRYGLEPRDLLPVLALDRAAAAALAPPTTKAARAAHVVEVAGPADLQELVEAYGGWMEDHALAEALVVAADLARPRRRFLVARVDDQPVGCAFVWFAGGTAYLSGLGVRPDQRGRGYGGALAVAAAHLGASAPVDVVWMYATDAGARLYSRLGFRPAGSLRRYGPAG